MCSQKKDSSKPEARIDVSLKSKSLRCMKFRMEHKCGFLLAVCVSIITFILNCVLKISTLPRCITGLTHGKDWDRKKLQKII